MQGVNRNPLPPGNVAVHPNGQVTIDSAGGRQYEVRGNGTLASYRSGAQSANFDANGRLSAVHTPALDIRHSSNGARTVVSQRPDKSVLVGTGPKSGYLERTVSSGGRTLTQRTYISGKSTSTRRYSSYSYKGVFLEHYISPVYYGPEFYGWAYYPWAAPVAYEWAWSREPWYGYYRGYFQPWSTYAGGSEWLTDYFLGHTLQDGYQQEMPPADHFGGGTANTAEPGPPPEPPLAAETSTPISPEIKNEIAAEVQRQLAYQSAASTGTAPEAVGELPSAMKPNHVFVVASTLEVTTSDQQTCTLSPGDVLRLTAAPAESSPLADLIVATSKRADCPAGVQVSVSLPDLQDMQNNMRSHLDSGLQELRLKQGSGGLPSAPRSAMSARPRPVIADPQLADDPNVAAVLEQQQREAREAEAGILQAVFVKQQSGNQ